MSHQITRRQALRRLGLGGLACPICLTLGAKAGLAAAGGIHWGYEGERGPGHWGSLEPEFKACELGLEQAPIDLEGAVRAELAGVRPQFQATRLEILNNGHTVQVNCAPGSGSTIDGERYELLQFHFHHPSEHLLSGKAFDLELHFVHKSAAGRLAVLGVFMRPGMENVALEPIWKAMPEHPTEARSHDVMIEPARLLPRSPAYFRYWGSLTTPPCSEGVLWSVYREPVEVSEGQIRRFAELFPLNARPVQPRHRRFLLQTL